MAQVTIPRWSLYAGVIALVAAIALSLGGIYTARGVNHDQTYYACLFAGSLSQVNTTGPTNCGRGAPISWNAVGPQGETGPQGPQGEIGPQGVPGQDASALLFRARQFAGSFTGTTSGGVVGSYPCPAGHQIISGGIEFSNSASSTMTMSYTDFDLELYRFRVDFDHGGVQQTSEAYSTIVCIADPTP